MDNVFCFGQEDFLVNCSYDSVTHFDTHKEDVGIVCYPEQGKMTNITLSSLPLFFLFVQLEIVHLETYVWLMVLPSTKVVWKFALEENGGLCVIILGINLMLWLFVDNLVSLNQVTPQTSCA